MIKLPKVIGHRGARNHAPENTLAAFRKAAELGITWVEFDVMLTKDLVPIIMHDEQLDRTTNGHGEVANFLYSDINQLDAGQWFSSTFINEKIPRFTDVLDCLSRYQLGANVEIKPTPGKDIITANKIISLVQSQWPLHLPPPLISSFSLESLFSVRKIDSTVPMGLLLDTWREDWLEIALELRCFSIHLNFAILTPERANAIKNAGYKLLVYTVNDINTALMLWSWGVDSIFSDCADEIIKSC